MKKRRFLTRFGTLLLQKGHLSLEMVFFLCLFSGMLLVGGIYLYSSSGEDTTVASQSREENTSDDFASDDSTENKSDELGTQILSVRSAIRPNPLRDPFQGSLSEDDINNLIKKSEEIEAEKNQVKDKTIRDSKVSGTKPSDTRLRNTNTNSVNINNMSGSLPTRPKQDVLLDGVILGKDKIAMLTIGGEQVTLAEGENSHNLQVQQITESGVVIMEGGVTEWISVP